MRAYADMHCDTLMKAFFEGEERLFEGQGMQSISNMIKAGQLLQFFAVFFIPELDEETKKQAGFTREIPSDDEYYSELKSILYSQVEKHSDSIAIALSAEDVRKNKAAGKASAMLTLEDGRFLNGSLDKLRSVYDDGVRAIGLTWNGENCLGYPNSADKSIMEKGLKTFGFEAVEEMNRLGILVDVSHLSDGGFFDVAKTCKKPFIASHSSCRVLTDHQRNLTDEMIKIIASKGGVAGVNFAPEFVNIGEGDPKSKAEFIASHVLHMYKVGGEDIIALGTDFDGIHGDIEIKHPEEMDLLFDILSKKGLSSSVLDKFASENVMRVLESI
ncbi:dipeptidase [Butyrivibrio sp. WCD3002]|uniref:dipeptidase n=1 Tax=Butyrivibrio sp. WCD3002 TaxID=1280676 RepID=UPI000422CA9C|nr:membrane dipeptidase [Butyrivibrio sp. WCD3002]